MGDLRSEMREEEASAIRVVDDAGYARVLAARALPAGAIVARFEGPEVGYGALSEEERRYAILIEGDRWVLTRTLARDLNHGCDANCVVGDALEVRALRELRPGEELTIDYVTVALADYLAEPEAHFWDPAWSFDCRCGSAKCVGRIDEYRVVGGARALRDALEAPRTRIDRSPGRGRGVYAASPIARGALIETAHVVVIPEAHWPPIEQVPPIYDISFSWGESEEHAAIGLGRVSLYNHSYSPNARFARDFAAGTISIYAISDISPSDEITVNYNEAPDDRSPLWFDPISETAESAEPQSR